MRSKYDSKTGARTSIDGDRLRDLRTALNLSTTEVAATTGLSVATISSLENEGSVPSTSTIEALHSLYGDDLFDTGAIEVEARND